MRRQVQGTLQRPRRRRLAAAVANKQPRIQLSVTRPAGVGKFSPGEFHLAGVVEKLRLKEVKGVRFVLAAELRLRLLGQRRGGVVVGVLPVVLVMVIVLVTEKMNVRPRGMMLRLSELRSRVRMRRTNAQGGQNKRNQY